MFNKAAWLEALDFVKSKWMFLLGHFGVSLGITWFTVFGGLAYLAGRESAQLQDEIPGTVNPFKKAAWVKYWAITRMLFRPVVLVQWLIPALLSIALIKVFGLSPLI